MRISRHFIVFLTVLFMLWLPESTAQGASFSTAAPTVRVKVQNRTVTLSWTKRSDVTSYQIFTCNASGSGRKCVKTVKGNSVTFKKLTYGKTFYFRVRGVRVKNGVTSYTKYSSVKKAEISLPAGKSTLKKLLQTALEPVGSTMYVWGGGWNKADTGAGKEARTIGVSARWKQFFLQQTSSYDYRTTRYQISDGLDCSGYVGWCIYNILNTKSGNTGYVMLAQKMASNFASRGWGTYKESWQVSDYKAGDIMSSSGHVWIVVGQCKDGSVVIVHSSPPGVQLAGTPDKKGNTNSQAVRLATYYMKNYYPEWYQKYPNCLKDGSYLTQYAQMRWDVSGRIMPSSA